MYHAKTKTKQTNRKKPQNPNKTKKKTQQHKKGFTGTLRLPLRQCLYIPDVSNYFAFIQ